MKKTSILEKVFLYALLYLVTIGIIASVFVFAPNQHNDFPVFRAFIIFFATVLLTKYFIYMTISPWYDVVTEWKRKKFAKLGRGSYEPRVSVIVPEWNEEVGILATLQTILGSTYRNLEIVVVNDGSTDGSDALIRQFLKQYEKESALQKGKIDIVYSYKQNGGKGSALNQGIILSTGEIVVAFDADCVIPPDTIGNFVRHFEDPTVMAAVGNVKIGNTTHALGTLQYLEFLFSFYFKKADSLLNTIYIIGGAAGAFRREIFHQIGLYSKKNITEDIDLSIRIQAAGMKIVYAADAVVYTEGASTLDGLNSQRLRWKQGRFQTFSEHRYLFFSTKWQHNKILTWLILPLAVFGDIQLFFELIFLIFLYMYSLVTHDFSSFISGIMVVSSIFFVQMIDDRNIHRGILYVLAPIGWVLFYITTIVEYRALIKSVWGMITDQKLVWQKWDRKGLANEAGVVSFINPRA